MRVLHTMLRVGNLQRSIDFYMRALRMHLLRTTDRPEQKYTLAFVGYGDESKHAVHELTYNYGVDRYDLAGFGHVGRTDRFQRCVRTCRERRKGRTLHERQSA